jgi:hypothetical protein
VFVEPETRLNLLTQIQDGEEVDVDVSELNNFIVEPDKIPGAQSEEDPATVKVSVGLIGGTRSVVRAIRSTTGTITIRSNLFAIPNIPVEYEVLPDTTNLLKLSLIGLGCEDDVAAAAGGLQDLFDGATQLGRDVVNPGTGPLDPLVDKVGNFPPIPTGPYNACLAAQQANPSVSQANCIFDISNGYLDDVKDFTLDLLCVGADRVQSEFEANKLFATANNVDGVTISLIVKDANGVNLLENFLPNATTPEDFGVQFSSTLGDLGPVIFDAVTAQFRATLTSGKVGTALVTAAFLVKGQTCMIPGQSDGFSITDKVLEIGFRPLGGEFPRRRRVPTHIQSAGGRRR